MRARFLQIVESIRSSLWFLPTLMALGAMILAQALGRADRTDLINPDGDLFWWVYSGSPDGAREVLATIAGSMITVAGVVFSITIVALSLASQQFGPRLLRNFMHDRGNQFVLGTFTSIFVYCILVLRTVRGNDDAEFVPHLSITIAIAAALIGLGVLIYFIHHVARSIQADAIIAMVWDELRDSIESLFPAHSERPEAHTAFPPTPPALVKSPTDGYIDAIDPNRLSEIAAQRGAFVRFLRSPGDFLIAGSLVAEVYSPDAVVEGDWILEHIAIGQIRTPMQDVAFSIDRLVEMALRALSPSLNDPFTAISCIDRLCAGLVLAGSRELGNGSHRDEEGRVRVIVPAPDADSLADTAFHQIRVASRGLPVVAIHLLEVIAMAIGVTRDGAMRRALLRHAALVRHEMEAAGGLEPVDLRAIDERFADVLVAAKSGFESRTREG